MVTDVAKEAKTFRKGATAAEAVSQECPLISIVAIFALVAIVGTRAKGGFRLATHRRKLKAQNAMIFSMQRYAIGILGGLVDFTGRGARLRSFLLRVCLSNYENVQF